VRGLGRSADAPRPAAWAVSVANIPRRISNGEFGIEASDSAFVEPSITFKIGRSV